MEFNGQLIGTGVKRGSSGFWLYVVADGVRVSGDLWGPYPTEVAARADGAKLRDHWIKVEQSLAAARLR